MLSGFLESMGRDDHRAVMRKVVVKDRAVRIVETQVGLIEKSELRIGGKRHDNGEHGTLTARGGGVTRVKVEVERVQEVIAQRPVRVALSSSGEDVVKPPVGVGGVHAGKHDGVHDRAIVIRVV